MDPADSCLPINSFKSEQVPIGTYNGDCFAQPSEPAIEARDADQLELPGLPPRAGQDMQLDRVEEGLASLAFQVKTLSEENEMLRLRLVRMHFLMERLVGFFDSEDDLTVSDAEDRLSE